MGSCDIIICNLAKDFKHKGGDKMTNRLKEVRLEKKLTQKEVSLQTGIPVNTYSNYERGDREPKLATWKKLADFFDVDVGYLQGVTNYENAVDLWAQSLSDNKEYQNKLENEFNKIKNSNHSTGKVSTDMQLAVSNMEHLASGTNEQAITKIIESNLSDMRSTVTNFYTDKNKKPSGIEGRLLSSENNFGKDWFYDDLNPDYYDFLIDSLTDFDRYISAGYTLYNIDGDNSEIKELINDIFLRLKENINPDNKK